MSKILHWTVENAKELINFEKDPAVESWIFMDSVMPVYTIVAAYLFFVLKVGPQWMSKRKPYDFKTLLVSYNAYQVLYSLMLTYLSLKLNAIGLLVHTECRTPDKSKETELELRSAAWFYFFSKVVDLLDTVFFVLRKKQSQVSFLHVYHHAGTVLASWCHARYFPGQEISVVVGFLNSVVHVIMYTYYMIAAMGPEYQKYIWWKKYMTWIQLIQFVIMLFYLNAIVVTGCQVPAALLGILGINIIIFFALFINFYRKAYNSKTQKRQ